MTIKTRVKFYYDYVISDQNFYLNFSEGGAELTAILDPGSYSFTELGNHVASKLSEFGSQEYTVTFDRTLRKYTISAPSNFELLALTGSNVGLGAWSTIGFSAVDLTGSNTYKSDLSAGKEYLPQFLPQNYISFNHWKEFAEAKINESASGSVEVYSLGTRQFMQMDIQFSTDIDQGKNSPIETNLTGIADLVSFMDYAITKGDVEFMEDRDNPAVFDTIILESTPRNNKGVGFSLKEKYGQGLPGYFDTGTLKFRKKV